MSHRIANRADVDGRGGEDAGFGLLGFAGEKKKSAANLPD